MHTRLAVALVMAGILAGCPEEVKSPERTAGQRCSTYQDCVPDGGVACGLLVDCVDLVCGAEPSLVLPCR